MSHGASVILGLVFALSALPFVPAAADSSVGAPESYTVDGALSLDER